MSIFSEFHGFFEDADWEKISTPMVMGVDGVYRESELHTFSGGTVDEAGMDDTGRDRFDELVNNYFKSKNKNRNEFYRGKRRF